MIGYIQGILLKKKPPLVIIDVHGIGYEVITSMITYEKLGALNQPLALYTHFLVREDAYTKQVVD
jgi:Holliday junction DNA helicase RuvA